MLHSLGDSSRTDCCRCIATATSERPGDAEEAATECVGDRGVAGPPRPPSRACRAACSARTTAMSARRLRSSAEPPPPSAVAVSAAGGSAPLAAAAASTVCALRSRFSSTCSSDRSVGASRSAKLSLAASAASASAASASGAAAAAAARAGREGGSSGASLRGDAGPAAAAAAAIGVCGVGTGRPVGRRRGGVGGPADARAVTAARLLMSARGGDPLDALPAALPLPPSASRAAAVGPAAACSNTCSTPRGSSRRPAAAGSVMARARRSQPPPPPSLPPPTRLAAAAAASIASLSRMASKTSGDVTWAAPVVSGGEDAPLIWATKAARPPCGRHARARAAASS